MADFEDVIVVPGSKLKFGYWNCGSNERNHKRASGGFVESLVQL